MLYFHPPYYQYEGMTVLPDYSDPRQFYYFPNRPHLAVDEHGRPAIRFIAFKADLDQVGPDEEHAVGFLVFDTSLDWPEDVVRKVGRKLQNDLQLTDPPRLAPLLFKSGTVRLMFLDKTTTPPEPKKDGQATPPPSTPPTKPAAADEDRWVTALEASGIPSLYGENRAIFSATLSKEATQLMYGAFSGFVPAGVIYNLTFVAMQPAFNVHVEADWSQVYHYLAQRFSADLIFASIDIRDIVSELEENKLVTITASLEGVGEEGMEDEFNEVRKQLQDLVLDKFFKPAVNPNEPKFDADDGGMIEDARSIRNLINCWPSAGYSRVELNESEIRTISIDYTVSRAVERTIAPQAHLSLFFEDYSLTREQVVTVVEGDDAFWKETEFDLSINADFEHEGIAAVGVDVEYGQASNGSVPSAWSFTLDKATPRVKRAAWYDEAAGHHFRYRYTVFFAPNAVPGPQRSISSGWIEHDGSQVVITPSDLYRLRQVEAQVVRSFPFDRYPQIYAHMQYKDANSNWTYSDSALLDQGNARLALAFRTAIDAPLDVDYRYTYLRANNEMIEGAWQTTDEDMVLVQDPVPSQLLVRLVVAGDRTKIANLIVDFKYDDDANDVHENSSVVMDSTTLSKPQQWTVQLANPTKRRYSYNQTLIDTDGNLSQTGWIEDERTTLPVGTVYARLMEVQPQLIGPALGAQQIESIVLHLRYADEANGVSADKQIVFAQPGKGESWSVQLKDASARDYSYEVVYVLNSGFERRIGPISSRDTFLIISSTLPKG